MTLGIDLSTDRIGVAFYDGREFVSFMEFGEVDQAVEWTERRMTECAVDRVVMNNYNEAFTDLFIQHCAIEYAMTAHLPYRALDRAKHLAKTQIPKIA